MSSHFVKTFEKVLEQTRNSSELARKLGVSEGLVRRWKKEEVLPRLDELAEISNFSGIPITEFFAPGFSREKSREKSTDSEFVSVPLHAARPAAGHGAVVEEEHEVKRFMFRYDWVSRFGPVNQLALVNIQGESMEPTLSNGDLVLLRYQYEFDREGIFVLNFDGDLYVKRVQRLGKDKVSLISDNTVYPPMEIDLDERLRVIGRAMWAGHKL